MNIYSSIPCLYASFTLARIVVSYVSTKLRLPWQEYEVSGNVGWAIQDYRLLLRGSMTVLQGSAGPPHSYMPHWLDMPTTLNSLPSERNELKVKFSGIAS